MKNTPVTKEALASLIKGVLDQARIADPTYTATTNDYINAINKIVTNIGYSYAIQVLGSEFESSFFEHCTFTIDSENGGIKFVNDKGEHVKQISKSENSILELFIPDTYNQTTSAPN